VKYVLSSFGLNNPYVVAEIPDHAVYPIGVEGDDFIDLDYTLLLAGTGFHFDLRALEYMRGECGRLRFLQPLLSSLDRLRQEGLLETYDGASIIAEHRERIAKKVELLCEDVLGWLSPVRAQWRVLRADRDLFLKKFGDPQRRAINEHHFAVVNAVLTLDGSLNQTLLRTLTGLIESRRRNFSSKEADQLKSVLRPLVCHTVIQDLIRFKTGAAILDWDDSQPYYERLYATRWEADDERRLATQARNLFEFALPELRPRTLDAVIRFIRDNRNVRALRNDVAAALSAGEKFDASLGRRIVKEVLEAELTIQKRMRKYRFLGAAATVLIPGASLLTEAAVEGAAMLGEEAVEGGFDRPHRWFYSLRE